MGPSLGFWVHLWTLRFRCSEKLCLVRLFHAIMSEFAKCFYSRTRCGKCYHGRAMQTCPVPLMTNIRIIIDCRQKIQCQHYPQLWCCLRCEISNIWFTRDISCPCINTLLLDTYAPCLLKLYVYVTCHANLSFLVLSSIVREHTPGNPHMVSWLYDMLCIQKCKTSWLLWPI